MMDQSSPDIVGQLQDAHDSLLGPSYGSSIFLTAISEIQQLRHGSKPDWCQGADSICHHPACSCILPDARSSADIDEALGLCEYAIIEGVRDLGLLSVVKRFKVEFAKLRESITGTPAQSPSREQVIECISQFDVFSTVAQVADAVMALYSLPCESPPAIDDVPSCGQENDYRRAQSSAGIESAEVQDTYLVGGPDLKAMSGSVESDRVIQLHFRRKATDADRKWLLEAINAKIAADKAGVGDVAQPSAGTSEPVAYRWRQPGNKHWIYDPTPEWIEDHKHEIELEPLFNGVAQPPMQPTEAMLNAARDWSRGKYGKPIGNDAAIGCWQAMFSAASMAEPLGNPKDPGWVKGRAAKAAKASPLPSTNCGGGK